MNQPAHNNGPGPKDEASHSPQVTPDNVIRFPVERARQRAEDDLGTASITETEALREQRRVTAVESKEASDQLRARLQSTPDLDFSDRPTGPSTLPVEQRTEQKEQAERERFKKYAPPLIIPGRSDVSIISYSGLMSPNYSLRRFLIETYRRFGMYTALYSLKGCDGTDESLFSTTNEDMIEFLKEKVDELPRGSRRKPGKRIFIGYSTGALAGLALEAREPGTFDAMILVGPPIRLRNKLHERLLSVLDSIDQRMGAISEKEQEAEDQGTAIPAFLARVLAPARRLYGSFKQFIKRGSINFGEQSFDDLEPGSSVKEIKKAPSFSRIPVQNVIYFHRIMKEARKALKNGKIATPIFICQGSDDQFTAPGCADEVVRANRLGSAGRQKGPTKRGGRSTEEQAALQAIAEKLNIARVYNESPHPVFFGPHQKEFYQESWDFMKEVLRILAPDFPEVDTETTHYHYASGASRKW